MNKITDFKGKRAGLILVLVILSLFFITYLDKDVKDAKTLSLRTAEALENTKSYSFDLSSNISILGEDISVIGAKGDVDSANSKVHMSMDFPDRSSIEAIIIGENVYFRELNGPWQTRGLDKSEIWNDKLKEQRSILQNADNMTMYREEDGWLLEIFPDEEVVIEEMRKAGLDDTESNIKSFSIRYWIEDGTFFVKKTETDIEVEMNFMGMDTEVKLVNVLYLSNFNEKMDIEVPV